MDFSELPEKAVLEVLRNLPPGDRLRCRAVCKKWKQLAVHPSLWENESLEVNDKAVCYICKRSCSPFVATALRLLPCLAKLTLGDFCGNEWGALLTSTPCAVEELVAEFTAKDGPLVAAILRRQASLGRLIGVCLLITCTENTKKSQRKKGLNGLFEEVLRTHGLETVAVGLDNACSATLEAATPVLDTHLERSHLKQLRYKGGFDPYLHWLLKEHAPTLEEVWILADDPLLVPLFTAMPNLRVLLCLVLEDMPALLQCPSLKDLELVVNVNDVTRRRLPATRAYLRAAAMHLDRLVFNFVLVANTNDEADPDEALDLVLCLAGIKSGASALRELGFKLRAKQQKSRQHLLPLAAVLRHLPALTMLDLDAAPTDDFLEAMDGVVLPRLVSLVVRQPINCAHEWAHSWQVKRLLCKNSLLHVVIKDVTKCWRICKFCKKNKCHTIPDEEDVSCVVFSHDPEEDGSPLHRNMYEINIDLD